MSSEKAIENVSVPVSRSGFVQNNSAKGRTDIYLQTAKHYFISRQINWTINLFQEDWKKWCGVQLKAAVQVWRPWVVHFSSEKNW